MIRYALLMLGLWAGSVTAEDFVLASPEGNAVVYVGTEEKPYVRRAVEDLVSDVRKITGQTLRIVEEMPASGNVVVVATRPEKRWEAYRIRTVSPQRLEITGSDPHGTQFGVYAFLDKVLGVDPFYLWTDNEPAKREKITIGSLDVDSGEPTFRYRGWFINDEDLLTEWENGGGNRNIDYPFYGQVVHPSVMEKVVETLVRARFNLIIPASFLDIFNPAEEQLVKVCSGRGVYLSQHHIEPCGVNAFTFFNYWERKDGTKPLFSYYSSREKLIEVWTEAAKRWSQYDNVIWQIGLRGIGDRPMWMADPNVPQTAADRGKIISDAMAAQVEIIRKLDSRENPPITTTLWGEGSGLLNAEHLIIPEGVISIFSDNCPGWKWQNDFYSVAREPSRRYGVYYHLQLWGSGPHLAQGISPHRMEVVFRETLEFPAHEYAILNVSNVRPFVLNLAAAGEMLWNTPSFDGERFLNDWCQRFFPSAPEETTALYREYFEAFAIHPVQKVPFLLDGQLRGLGNTIVRSLVQTGDKVGKVPHSTEPWTANFRHEYVPIRPKNVKVSQKNNGNAEADFVHMDLADMHPKPLGTEEKKAYVVHQREQFASLQERAEKLLPRLTESERTFLRTNFLAHDLTMKSLSGWVEELILARLAMEKNDVAQKSRHVENAREYLRNLAFAQEILTQGKTWEYWYRGEKKMNLPSLRKSMENIEIFP